MIQITFVILKTALPLKSNVRGKEGSNVADENKWNSKSLEYFLNRSASQLQFQSRTAYKTYMHTPDLASHMCFMYEFSFHDKINYEGIKTQNYWRFLNIVSMVRYFTSFSSPTWSKLSWLDGLYGITRDARKTMRLDMKKFLFP